MFNVHVPATFSVCSNIPGHTEPVHKVSNGNPQNLVDEMVKLQLEHQTTASRLMREKFQWVFNILTRKEDIQQQLETEKSGKLDRIHKIYTVL